MKTSFEVPVECNTGLFLSPTGALQYFEQWRAIQLAYLMHQHLLRQGCAPEIYISTVSRNHANRWMVSIEKPQSLHLYDCYMVEKFSLSEVTPSLYRVHLEWIESKDACEMPMGSDRFYLYKNQHLALLLNTITQPTVSNIPWLEEMMVDAFKDHDITGVSATGMASIQRPFANDMMVVAVPLVHETLYLPFTWEIPNASEITTIGLSDDS